MKSQHSLTLCALLLFLALVFSGCAHSSGVVPMGRDTYLLSKSGLGSESLLKASAYREASEWCKQQGLVMVPVSEKTKSGNERDPFSSAEIVFRGVKEGDKDDKRTTVRQAPDTVIEVIKK